MLKTSRGLLIRVKSDEKFSGKLGQGVYYRPVIFIFLLSLKVAA